MIIAFYIASIVAIASTFMVIINKNAVRALLYLIISLLAVAVIFYILGAPYIAALQAIIYAGAIMTLFIFVIMLLNVKEIDFEFTSKKFNRSFILPLIMIILLFVDFLYIIQNADLNDTILKTIEPKAVGKALYTDYAIAVQLAAIMLLGGMIGAYHIGRRSKKVVHRFLKENKEQ